MITIIPLAILECLNSSQDIKVVSRDNKVASRDNKVASRDNMKNLFVAFFKSWWRMWKEKMLSVGHSCPQAGEIIYFILHIPKEYFFKNKITSRDFRIIFHYNLFSNFYLRSNYKIKEKRSWEVQIIDLLELWFHFEARRSKFRMGHDTCLFLTK